MTENTQDLHCSFCSKHKDEVSRLIAGPGVYICDECIDSCYSLIKRDTSSLCLEQNEQCKSCVFSAIDKLKVIVL